jgi:hypothetical protein
MRPEFPGGSTLRAHPRPINLSNKISKNMIAAIAP